MKRNLIIAVLAITVFTTPMFAQCGNQGNYYNYNPNPSTKAVIGDAVSSIFLGWGCAKAADSYAKAATQINQDNNRTVVTIVESNNATARYYYDRQLDAIKVVSSTNAAIAFDNNRTAVKVKAIDQMAATCNAQFNGENNRLACMRIMLGTEQNSGNPNTGAGTQQAAASHNADDPASPQDVVVRNLSRSKSCMDIPGVAPAIAQMSHQVGLQKAICINPGEDFAVGNARSLNILLKGTDNGLCTSDFKPNYIRTMLGGRDVMLYTVDDDAVSSCNPRAQTMTANAATSTVQTGQRKEKRQPIRD